MSYYLMVFDPEKAPKGREDFLAWFHEQTAWKESHDYNEPVALAPILRPYFDELIRDFPPMNGSYSSKDVDDPRVTDYSIGSSIIYGAFAWSVSVEAHDHIRYLAEKHTVGFFDVSTENGEIWFPPKKNEVSQSIEPKNFASKPWWKFWK
jgi:hypothetical protein